MLSKTSLCNEIRKLEDKKKEYEKTKLQYVLQIAKFNSFIDELKFVKGYLGYVMLTLKNNYKSYIASSKSEEINTTRQDIGSELKNAEESIEFLQEQIKELNVKIAEKQKEIEKLNNGL